MITRRDPRDLTIDPDHSDVTSADNDDNTGTEVLKKAIAGPGVRQLRRDQATIKRLAVVKANQYTSRYGIRAELKHRPIKLDKDPMYETSIVTTPLSMQLLGTSGRLTQLSVNDERFAHIKQVRTNQNIIAQLSDNLDKVLFDSKYFQFIGDEEQKVLRRYGLNKVSPLTEYQMRLLRDRTQLTDDELEKVEQEFKSLYKMKLNLQKYLIGSLKGLDQEKLITDLLVLSDTEMEKLTAADISIFELSDTDTTRLNRILDDCPSAEYAIPRLITLANLSRDLVSLCQQKHQEDILVSLTNYVLFRKVESDQELNRGEHHE